MDKITTTIGDIFYHDLDDLKKFNRKLYFHGGLKDGLRRWGCSTDSDDVERKLHIIALKIDQFLRPAEMDFLKFDTVILPNKSEVAAKYEEVYHEKKKLTAFYRSTNNTVYWSAKNATLRVVSHEIGHVGFVKSLKGAYMPVDVHELVAQYIEERICA